MRSALLAIACAGMPTLALAQDGATHRYALTVGANDGGAARATLRYAQADAKAMRNVLTTLGGVDEDDASLVLDPTVADLRGAMEALNARLAEDTGRTEVIFYYSGHSDEDGLLIGESRLPWSEIRAWMDGLDAKVRMAVLDSCASGALIRSKGGEKVAPFLVDEGTNVDGLAYITSSSRDEVSQEADRIGGSYFTHYFTTGLRGAADRSGDSRVTLTEAYSFAREETLRRTERTRFGPQHANHEFDLSGSGDLVLTDLSSTDASVVLEAGFTGRAALRDADGSLVAELFKSEDHAVSLALSHGDYQLTLTDDGRYAVADVVVPAGVSTPIGMEDLTWYAGEEAVARGADVAVIHRAVTASGNEYVRFQLVPGLPPTPPGKVDRALLGFISAGTEGLTGFGVALASIDVKGPQQGHTVALGASLAQELRGTQWSVGANVAKGTVRGGQFSSIVNIAQAPTFRGMQASGLVNWLEGNADGIQATAAVNVSTGGLRGLQAATLNIAQGFSGLQLGIVNVGQRVNGVQMGIVNIAGEVDGAQLGIVNVAKDVRGVPLGLLSIERDGRHDLLVFASETDWINGEIRLGGDVVYTQLGIGGRPQEHLYLGAGVGVHAPLTKGLWMDLDLVYAAYNDVSDPGALFEKAPQHITRGRATVGFQVLKEFAPFVGASLNLAIPTGNTTTEVFPTTPSPDGTPGDRVKVWPGAFAGLQF